MELGCLMEMGQCIPYFQSVAESFRLGKTCKKHPQFHPGRCLQGKQCKRLHPNYQRTYRLGKKCMRSCGSVAGTYRLGTMSKRWTSGSWRTGTCQQRS
jgi:hypothetical protein